jgi:hypothetical protein
MIVKFSTRYGQLTMLGEAAIQLIKLMGHSGTVPGAILSGELPAAVTALSAGSKSPDIGLLHLPDAGRCRGPSY